MAIPEKIQTWQMVEPGKLEKTSIDVPELQPGEVLVEVAGVEYVIRMSVISSMEFLP